MRTVLSTAQQNFIGCGSNREHEALKELRACDEAACAVVDCQYAAWKEWDACDQQCGGGSQRRSRAIATTPLNGGAGCKAEAKEEMQVCNMATCMPCRDGE